LPLVVMTKTGGAPGMAFGMLGPDKRYFMPAWVLGVGQGDVRSAGGLLAPACPTGIMTAQAW
jgi:hypothetical protein